VGAGPSSGKRRKYTVDVLEIGGFGDILSTTIE